MNFHLSKQVESHLFSSSGKSGVEVDNLGRGTVGRSLNLVHTVRIAAR